MEYDLDDLARQDRIQETERFLIETDLFLNYWSIQDRKMLAYAATFRDIFFDTDRHESQHYI